MELMTPAELSKFLKCSKAFVYKIATAGTIPCVRIPMVGVGEKRRKDMVRFKKDDVFAWIEQHHRKE